MSKLTPSKKQTSLGVNGIPETLTYTAACDALKCSRAMLDRLVSAGKVRVYKIGQRHVLVNADDVRSYFAQPANYRVIA